MRSYRGLFLTALALALLVSVLARLPRREAARPVTAPPAPATPLTLVVRGGALEPGVVSVPKGVRVLLTVLNRGDRAVTLTLAGYQDRFTAGPVAPEGAWHGEFLADLPGEDFAWMLDGRPAGRFDVTGSHLVEGHR